MEITEKTFYFGYREGLKQLWILCLSAIACRNSELNEDELDGVSLEAGRD